MELPVNHLRQSLRDGHVQIGLWSQLASPLGAEVVAGSGFDFIVLDTEHAPNEVPAVLAQLQALTGGSAAGVVRVAWNDPVLFKRVLDVGVGPGLLAAQMAEAVGPTGRVRGIDISEDMLAIARRRELGTEAAPVELGQGEATALPVPDQYDVMMKPRLRAVAFIT